MAKERSKILIMDDHPGLAKLAGELLGFAGAKPDDIEVASNVADAKKILNKKRRDLLMVVADQNMNDSETDGIDILESASGYGVPNLVLMSGVTGAKDKLGKSSVAKKVKVVDKPADVKPDTFNDLWNSRRVTKRR